MKLAALMRKEFHRFFHDPRLIVTMLLPGLLIFLLYSIIGSAVNGKEAKTYRVYCDEAPPLVVAAVGAIARENTVEWLPLEDEEAATAEIREKKAAAIVKFGTGFDPLLEGGNVEIVYDPVNEDSLSFYSTLTAALNELGRRFTVSPAPLSGVEAVGRSVMQSVLPLIVVCFIFSACMSVTLESVAGEKERGTLSTVLVTSVKRSHIALGKILPLSCISMLGALSSFLGTALSMPKLMGVSMGFLGGYSAWSYVLLCLLILSAVPLVVSLIALVSTLSRSVKEASAYTGVVMILVMVVSLVSAFVPTIGDWAVALPILNATVQMQGILGGRLPVWQSLVSVGANLLYTALLVVVITKLLSSERVMFGK